MCSCMWCSQPTQTPTLIPSPHYMLYMCMYTYYYRLTKDVDTTRPGGNAEYDRLVRPEPNY